MIDFNMIRRFIRLMAAIFMTLAHQNARADTIQVAVSANFTDAAREIARVFEETSGHSAVLSFGASGQFYVQIKEGAPFQVFLSADQERAKRLIDEGFGVAGEDFTYAIGRLVLWSRKPGLNINEDTLKKGEFSKIAIANPFAAPYGAAAIDVMKSIDVYAALQPKIVQGNSIAQTFQFANTDNAEFGFIALSQIVKLKEGSWWIIPGKYYKDIKQDAVLLKSGEMSSAARAFMKFLKSPIAHSIIQQFGYGTETVGGRRQ